MQLNSTTQQPSNQPPARSDLNSSCHPKRRKKNTPTHFIITTGCNMLIHFGANLLLSVSRFHHGFFETLFTVGFLRHGKGDSVWLEFLDPVARAFPSKHLRPGDHEITFPILLMEEILHHLGWLKPYKWWDIHHPWWCRGFCPSTVSQGSKVNWTHMLFFVSMINDEVLPDFKRKYHWLFLWNVKERVLKKKE